MVNSSGVVNNSSISHIMCVALFSSPKNPYPANFSSPLQLHPITVAFITFSALGDCTVLCRNVSISLSPHKYLQNAFLLQKKIAGKEH